MSLRAVQLDEARLALRWAAAALTPVERAALDGFCLDRPDTETAKMMGVSRQAVWQAKMLGLKRMRRRLRQLRIERMEDLIA
jgi:DNA-directed RNA polymerase specialized sigma24 family protein